MADEERSGPENVRVEALFSSTDSGETEIVQMFFGMRPAVLITPERDGSDLVLQVRVVDMKPKHLVRLLETVAAAVDRARKKAKKEKREAASSSTEEDA